MSKQKKNRVENIPGIYAEEFKGFKLAELVSKITVTKDTPNGLLAQWQDEYPLFGCRVILS